jgi:hypothetical protein
MSTGGTVWLRRADAQELVDLVWCAKDHGLENSFIEHDLISAA